MSHTFCVLMILLCSYCLTLKISLSYYADDRCVSGQIAQRTFEHEECFNLLYNPSLPQETECKISNTCFSDPYNEQNDCLGTSSLTPTSFFANASGITMMGNPVEGCGAQENFPINYNFGQCYFSDFYKGCHFVVEPEDEEFAVDGPTEFLTLAYYSNDECDSRKFVAERSFEHQRCFNVLYDGNLPRDSDCEISMRCFLDPYEQDACPHTSSLNSTHYVNYPADAVAMVANPYEACGPNTLIPVEYVFGQCYISDFFPGCYFKVNRRGLPADSSQDLYVITTGGNTTLFPSFLIVLMAVLMVILL